MAEDPYRGDLEAALQRAAELEQEVERLRRELEAATAAARGRALVLVAALVVTCAQKYSVMPPVSRPPPEVFVC